MLSEIERELLIAVRRFVAEKVRPAAIKHEAEGSYPAELIAAAKELGLFGLVIPPTFGGLGLTLPAFVEIMETAAYGWTSFASHLTSHATVAYIILRHGTEMQRQSLLPRMATGTLHAAILLTEEHAGSDLQAIRTRADCHGDNYIISGKKTYISNGQHASLLLVLAQVDPSAKPPKRGLALFIIEPQRDDGVFRAKPLKKMAFDCVDTNEIRFDAVQVSSKQLVGGSQGRGLSQLLDGLELGRLAIAASAVGLAAAALDEALTFAKTRKAFGVEIKQHQAVRLRVAEMATAVNSARSLTAAAATALQIGAADGLTAMAKLAASEAALQVTTDSLRIHGGSGYIRGVMAERFFREAPLYIVGEGTNDILKLNIARTLFGD